MDLSDCSFDGLDLKGVNLNGANLTYATFRGAALSKVAFVGANLLKADFAKARLANVDFSAADLFDTQFHEASLDSVNFYGSRIHNASFRGAQLSHAAFNRTVGKKTSFFAANVADSTFENCVFEEFDFARSQFSRTQWRDVLASSSIFNGASLSDSQLNRVDLRNSLMINFTIQATGITDSDLRQAEVKLAPSANIAMDGTLVTESAKPEWVTASGTIKWAASKPNTKTIGTFGTIVEAVIDEPVIVVSARGEAEIQVLAAPEIPKACQKAHPVGKKQRYNGLATLTDGKTKFPFYPCANTIELQLKLNFQRWPESIHPNLYLQIVLKNFDADGLIRDIAFFPSNATADRGSWPIRHADGIAWIKLKSQANGETFTLRLTSNAPETGIYEIAIAAQEHRQFDSLPPYKTTGNSP